MYNFIYRSIIGVSFVRGRYQNLEGVFWMRKDDGEPLGCDIFMENAAASPHDAGSRLSTGKKPRKLKRKIPKGFKTVSVKEALAAIMRGAGK